MTRRACGNTDHSGGFFILLKINVCGNVCGKKKAGGLPAVSACKIKAGERVRTADIQLGKLHIIDYSLKTMIDVNTDLSMIKR